MLCHSGSHVSIDEVIYSKDSIHPSQPFALREMSFFHGAWGFSCYSSLAVWMIVMGNKSDGSDGPTDA